MKHLEFKCATTITNFEIDRSNNDMTQYMKDIVKKDLAREIVKSNMIEIQEEEYSFEQNKITASVVLLKSSDWDKIKKIFNSIGDYEIWFEEETLSLKDLLL